MSSPLGTMVDWPGERLADLVGRLAAAHLTVACAESLTGGLLTAVLTEVPGVSAVVRGGLVVYATDLKHSLAGVDADLLAARGPVDPDVAVQLADGARRVCGATVGLGLTGVAGPDPQHDVAVGTWYVALVGPAGSTVRRQEPSSRPADRSAIRASAVRAALELLDDVALPTHPSATP